MPCCLRVYGTRGLDVTCTNGCNWPVRKMSTKDSNTKKFATTEVTKGSLSEKDSAADTEFPPDVHCDATLPSTFEGYELICEWS